MRVGEELGIGQELLQAVADVVHQVLELRVVLLVANDLLEELLAFLPLLEITEALDERPEVSQCSVGLLVLLHIVLCSFDNLLRCARVDLCITLNEQAQGRDGLCVVVAFTQLQDCLLEAVEHRLAFITGELLLSTVNRSLGDLGSAVGDDLAHLLNLVLQVLGRRSRLVCICTWLCNSLLLR